MLIIENISGVEVDINDLGLSMAPNETIDLTIEVSAREVAASGRSGGDLNSLIASGNIAVKDPSDITTNLSTLQAIAAISTHNDTHYRMPVGGRIADAIDVDLSAAGEFLRFDGNMFVRQTTSEVASEIESNINFDNIRGGHNAWEIVDADNDTRVTVANATGDDEDVIRMFVGGSEAARMTNQGLTLFSDDNPDSEPRILFQNISAGGNAATIRHMNGGLQLSATGSAQDQILLLDGADMNMRFSGYANTRDNGSPDTVLFTDSIGNLQHGSLNRVRTTGDEMTGDLIMSGPRTDIILQDAAGIIAGVGSVISADIGTETSPSVIIGDDNTGLYRPGNNMLGLVAGGSEKIRIGNTGTPQVIISDNIRFSNYPSSRNDGPTTMALYVDADGDIRYGNITGLGGGGESGIVVQDDGIDVSGAPHTTVNFIGDTVTATDAGNGQTDVTIDTPLRPTFCIFAEENGAISVSNNNFEYSFGNGAVNTDTNPSGIPVGVPCTLIAITASARNASSGTSTFSISVTNNGNIAATSEIASATGVNNNGTIATQIEPDTVNFNFGDTVQFLTATTSGSWGDVRVVAWFERTA